MLQMKTVHKENEIGKPTHWQSVRAPGGKVRTKRNQSQLK